MRLVRYVRWAIVAVLVMFVLGVFWFAWFGRDVVTRQAWTNAPEIPAGTTWIRSDEGLDGGPVTAVTALSATLTVYAATREDALYVSANGGRRWVRTGESSTGRYVVGIVAMAGSDGVCVGKAVYGEGYFRSEDGGQTWVRSSRTLRGRALSCLAAAADPSSLLVVGTADAGLFVSRDGGRSWSSRGRTVLGLRVACAAVSRDGSVVYAGTQDGGLYRSRDGGNTWNTIPLPFASQPVVTGVDIDPGQTDHIVVAVSGNGVAVSEDAGATWALSVTDALPSDCTSVCFVTGGKKCLAVGTQFGSIWYSRDGVEWSTVHRLIDGNRVYQLARAGDGVVAATSRGILTSPDGISWRESNAGIRNLALEGVASSPSESKRMFAATDDGVYSSEDAGATWKRSSPSQATMCVAVLGDGTTVLAGTACGTILRSTDTGAHWGTVGNGVPGMKVGAIVVAEQPGTVCMATDDGFAVSRDGGATWTARNTGLTPSSRDDGTTPRIEVATILTEGGTPSVVLLGLTGQGLFVSRDFGLRWTAVTPGPATPWISCLAQDSHSGRIYAGTGADGVLTSDDGATWSPTGKGLSTLFSVPGTVNALAVTSDGVTYAATTTRGVAVSWNGGGSWRRVNKGLPDLNVRRIVVAESGVYAVTKHNIMRLVTGADQ